LGSDDDGGLRRRYVEEDEAQAQHALWRRDRIELKSVGIDIGSSTSHLIFSTLEMRRQGAVLSSRFELTGRRVDYESEILITPFVNGASINTDRLSDFFDRCYQAAGMHPGDVDTGAVITTGDAARKDNAAAIVQLFSEQSGRFVCASAGPLLEAKMAAYGSGAVARSTEADSKVVLNLDVGGGTAKLALINNGVVFETAAINVGARLITFDDDGRITTMERAAAIVSQHRDLHLALGRTASEAEKQALARALAESLLEAASSHSLSDLTKALMITEPLRGMDNVQTALFSGGVSEYLYEVEAQTFGDLGLMLGQQIRALIPSYLRDIKVETPLERIRATVIGASQFTAQVSGNTIYVNNPALLPLRNLQVVTVRTKDVELSALGITQTIKLSLESAEASDGEEPIAIAVHWPHGPAFGALRALCEGICTACKKAIQNHRPLVVILDCDIARLVGANLSEVLDGYENIICIDGVQLQDFDYIDISEEHAEAGVVTVVIKSLVFTG
jgi:ethanolamine utilization protein EutA